MPMILAAGNLPTLKRAHEVESPTTSVDAVLSCRRDPISIFQNLVAVVASMIYGYHDIYQRFGDNFQAIVDDMANLTFEPVWSLLKSHIWRSQLLQLSRDLKHIDHPNVRDALHKDDLQIANLLHTALTSMEYRKNIFSLTGDNAQCFLDVIQYVLDRGLLGTAADSKATVRRLFVKLSESSGVLPSSVSIFGVKLVEKGPISGGGFADIYRGYWQGKEVALKLLRVRLDQQSKKLLSRETLTWQQLRHPFVLPFLGIDAETFPSSVCLVSPWMPEGTVRDFIKRHGAQIINIERRISEVAQGLEYLHSQGVVHGDLRGANIVIDNDWHARIADLGLAIFADATAATHTSDSSRGSTRWMAPELIFPTDFGLSRAKKTPATDVYSFACLCVEVYTGNSPFSDVRSDVEVIFRVMERERPGRPTYNGGDSVAMPGALWSLVQRCWTHQPVHRPNMIEVVNLMKLWDR